MEFNTLVIPIAFCLLYVRQLSGQAQLARNTRGCKSGKYVTAELCSEETCSFCPRSSRTSSAQPPPLRSSDRRALHCSHIFSKCCKIRAVGQGESPTYIPSPKPFPSSSFPSTHCTCAFPELLCALVDEAIERLIP